MIKMECVLGVGMGCCLLGIDVCFIRFFVKVMQKIVFVILHTKNGLTSLIRFCQKILKMVIGNSLFHQAKFKAHFHKDYRLFNDKHQTTKVITQNME